eukprot:2264249-Ditylum_brightwellii.AAC.1
MAVNNCNGNGRFLGQLELQGISDIKCSKSSCKIGFIFFQLLGNGIFINGSGNQCICFQRRGR